MTRRDSSGLRRLAVGVVAVAFALVVAACGGNPAAPSPAQSQPPAAGRFSQSAFREAARITAAGSQVLATARAGMFERDLKQVVDAAFLAEGSVAPAFAHIVASGPNTLELHYPGGDRQIGDGDLVLIDIGATSDDHCADMSRTFPVSGQFTPRQREIYELVLAARTQAAARLRPGVDSLRNLDGWVREFFRASPLRARDANGVERTMDAFFVHALGHYVGRQVHGEDTGWNTAAPVEPDQVLTLEPGLYLPVEGIGVRIEDTFLVTSQGLECLTCACPYGVRP